MYQKVVVVGGQAGHLHLHKREEVAQEEEEEGEEGVLLLLIGIREGVAGLGSQLLAVGEEGEGQQNRGEVGKRVVKVAVGSLGIQVLQVEVGEGHLSLEAEAEGSRVEHRRI